MLTRVAMARRRRLGRSRAVRRRAVPGDRVTHERPQFLLGHSTASTWSTMPMIAASTGAPLRPSASPAARPSITTSTFSCTPAPTESTASSAVPRGLSSRRQAGRAAAWRLRTWGASVWRRRCRRRGRAASDPQITSDRRCRRCRRRSAPRSDGTESCFLAAHEEHCFADTGADRIDRDERPADGDCRRRQRLQHQQLDAVQVLVLARDDDVADDLGELHVAHQSPAATSTCVDDADDGGIDRAVLHARRHARGAAADDEHGFADAGVDGVDGDQ